MHYIIGIFIAFFLALIIFTKKGRNLADLILGSWMLLIGIHLATYYSYITNLVFEYPSLLGINMPIPFFHGVFLYLYVEALSEPSTFKSKKWLLHFILPLFIIIIELPFFLLSSKEKMEVFQNNGRGYETVMNISSILLTISGIIYVIITYRLLQRHRIKIMNQFSNQEKINLNWLRFLSFTMMVMWVLIIFVQNDTIIFSTTSIFVVFIGYFGIKQVGIFTNQNVELMGSSTPPFVNSEILSEPNIEKKKYAKSGLSEEVAQEIHQKLRHLMVVERLFIEPELTLADLANLLEIHPNYLSQIINEIEGVNFYDYINGLRIEEFKRLVALPENQKFTLLALAFDCGFNSKSSFNRFFKKYTTLSPSEYLKQLSEK